eukprot:6188391-Pleurochrysis_carterae.AAC.1
MFCERGGAQSRQGQRRDWKGGGVEGWAMWQRQWHDGGGGGGGGSGRLGRRGWAWRVSEDHVRPPEEERCRNLCGAARIEPAAAAEFSIQPNHCNPHSL